MGSRDFNAGMNRLTLILGLLGVPTVLSVNVVNIKNPDYNQRATWGYQASNGPSTWPATFATCAGTSQSPIDIKTATVSTADPGKITATGYDLSMAGTLTNNEHTIQFAYGSTGSKPYITGGRLGTQQYEFLQLHWHWGSVNTRGSEHTVDGKEYPAEIHLVHWNKKYANVAEAVTKADGLAVLGFFYEVSSADNGNLDSMLGVVQTMARKQRKIKAKNKNKGGRLAGSATTAVPGTIRLDQLIPIAGIPEEYYYYMGSLTTPTCDEVVQWTVFPTTVPISERQLNILRTLMDSSMVTLNDNYRPPQPLNGRTVFKRQAATTSNGGTVAAVGASAGLAGAVLGAGLTAIGFGLISFLAPATRRSSRRSQEPAAFRHTVQPSQQVYDDQYYNYN